MKVLSILLFIGVYILFVLDRLILSVSTRTLSNFETWGELHLPEDKREYKKVKVSLRRVLVVLVLFVLYSLFTGCTRKDYYCDCTYINPVHGEQQDSFMIEANTKQSASEHCESGGGVYYVDFECELR
jgi:hypothetical protein